MNKALVIYDNTGKIWSIIYGAQEAPQGLQCMWVDIPENAILERIDMETGEPVFSYLPETDLGQIQKDLLKLNETTEEIKQTVAASGKDADTVKLAASFAAASFTDQQALQVKTLYRAWESCVGGSLAQGERVLYKDRLYKVRQDIQTVLENQPPSIDTAALYEEIVEDHAGTVDDPIPYNNNMELFEGKYYVQDDVIYHCTRSTGQAVYNPLADLVGIYVETV